MMMERTLWAVRRRGRKRHQLVPQQPAWKAQVVSKPLPGELPNKQLLSPKPPATSAEAAAGHQLGFGGGGDSLSLLPVRHVIKMFRELGEVGALLLVLLLGPE